MRHLTLRTLPFAVCIAFAFACGGGTIEPPSDPAIDPPVDPDAGASDPGTSTADPGIATSTNVRLIVEPNGQAGADVVAAITNARRSVHLTMYLLSDTDIINALIERARAGVDVKVVLNKSFPTSSIDQSSVFNTLQRGGVRIAWASTSYTYTHEKCLIIDSTVAWIMTMNFADSSSKYNREYLVVDADADDVAEAEAIFAADFAGQAITPTGKLLVAPTNAQPLMIRLIDTATRTVDIAAQTFSDSYVTTALVNAKARGVAVRLVIANDRTPTAAQVEALARLKAAQIPIVASGPEAGQAASTAKPYHHAKALIADGARAYVGSANFTINSLRYNRELGVIVGDPASLATLADTVNADFRAGVAQ
jgi:cardiolipin synthase